VDFVGFVIMRSYADWQSGTGMNGVVIANNETVVDAANSVDDGLFIEKVIDVIVV
jgi:hypothetical protein